MVLLGIQPTKVNEVLAKWVTATPTGSMPPYSYEINGKVFVVKTAGGEYAKLRFTVCLMPRVRMRLLHLITSFL